MSKSYKQVRVNIGLNESSGSSTGIPAKNSVSGFSDVYFSNHKMSTLKRLNLISKYQLDVIYGKDKKGMNCPVSAFSSTNGFILGTNWKAESIMVSKTNDNQKFQYIVNGIVEWHLLGITIYTQAKTYKGTISTIKIGR